MIVCFPFPCKLSNTVSYRISSNSATIYSNRFAKVVAGLIEALLKKERMGEMTNKIWWEDLQIHMVEWRRHLHRNPEVSFHEEKTSTFIADMLESFGIEVQRHVGDMASSAFCAGNSPGRSSCFVPTWTRSRFRMKKTWNTLRNRRGPCMPAVMTAMSRSCWERHCISVAIGPTFGAKSVFVSACGGASSRRSSQSHRRRCA